MLTLTDILPYRKHLTKIKGVGEKFKKIENWDIELNVFDIGNICVHTHASLITMYNDTL